MSGILNTIEILKKYEESENKELLTSLSMLAIEEFLKIEEVVKSFKPETTEAIYEKFKNQLSREAMSSIKKYSLIWKKENKNTTLYPKAYLTFSRMEKDTVLMSVADKKTNVEMVKPCVNENVFWSMLRYNKKPSIETKKIWEEKWLEKATKTTTGGYITFYSVESCVDMLRNCLVLEEIFPRERRRKPKKIHNLSLHLYTAKELMIALEFKNVASVFNMVVQYGKRFNTHYFSFPTDTEKKILLTYEQFLSVYSIYKFDLLYFNEEVKKSFDERLEELGIDKENITEEETFSNNDEE